VANLTGDQEGDAGGSAGRGGRPGKEEKVEMLPMRGIEGRFTRDDESRRRWSSGWQRQWRLRRIRQGLGHG